MSRWKVIFAAFVIFTAGAAVGAIVTRNFAPRIVKKTTVTTAPPFPSTKSYLERLDRQVQLTAEQRAKVEKILDASQDRIKKLWEPVSPIAKEEYRRTRKEISEVLTEEQREKWKKQWREKGAKDSESKPGEKRKEACQQPACKVC